MASVALLWEGGDGKLYRLSRADIFAANACALDRYLQQREAGASDESAKAASIKALQDYTRAVGIVDN